MNTRFTRRLLIIALIAIFGGIIYFGLKLAIANKLIVNPIPPAPTTQTSAQDTPNPEIEKAKIEQSTTCQSSDECTIISRPDTKDGKKINTIECLNKAYLSTCDGCSTSEELVADTTQDATCACVKNLCNYQFKN